MAGKTSISVFHGVQEHAQRVPKAQPKDPCSPRKRQLGHAALSTAGAVCADGSTDKAQHDAVFIPSRRVCSSLCGSAWYAHPLLNGGGSGSAGAISFGNLLESSEVPVAAMSATGTILLSPEFGRQGLRYLFRNVRLPMR